MGKAPQKGLREVPLAQQAERVAAFLTKNPPKLRDLTITPLGPTSIHYIFNKRAGEPHEKDKVISGTVTRGDAKTRFSFPDQDLKKGVAPGAPNPNQPSSRNTTVTRLENPVLEIDDKTGTLKGVARLSIDDSQYPQGLASPTVINLYVSSEPLKVAAKDPKNPKFSISANYGPIQADFKLKLKLDTGNLSRIELAKAIGSGDVSALVEKLSGPGFDLSGLVQYALIKKIPLLNRVLKTSISISSSSTKPIAKPISTAPANRQFNMLMWGVIPVPAGAIFDTMSLGYGITSERWRPSSGQSFTAAALAVPSPTKLTEISTYLYVNYYRVEKLSDGWELSINLSFAPKNVIGGGEKTVDDIQLQWQKASDRQWLPSPNGGFVHAEDTPVLFGEVKLLYNF